MQPPAAPDCQAVCRSQTNSMVKCRVESKIVHYGSKVRTRRFDTGSPTKPETALAALGDEQCGPLGCPMLDTWSALSRVLRCLLLGAWPTVALPSWDPPRKASCLHRPHARGTLVREDDSGLRQVGFAAGSFILDTLALLRLRLRI